MVEIEKDLYEQLMLLHFKFWEGTTTYASDDPNLIFMLTEDYEALADVSEKIDYILERP